MQPRLIYFDSMHALKVHEIVIAQSGGKKGVLNNNLLESVIGHIQDDQYYPEFEDKLTHLVFSFIKNHAFTDGNKRTGVALGAYFLEINGFDYCVKNFIEKMENVAVWVAEGKVDKSLLLQLITSLIYEDDYSEELKLHLISAIY